MESVEDHVLVLFGGDGDLSEKKLLPALRSFHRKEGSFPVLIVSNEDQDIHSVIENLGIQDWNSSFLSDLYFLQQDVNEKYSDDLRKKVDELSEEYSCASRRIFYFALPYFLFPPATSLVVESDLDTENSIYVYEKPFGAGPDSSSRILNQIRSNLSSDKLYFVDHYLAKEIVEDVLSLRFGSKIIGELWNARDVKEIQLELSEDFGVEGRGGYYDSAGAIRDVFQSHLLQILGLCLMRQPGSLDTSQIREKKVEAIENLNPPSPENMVFGQYGGPDSKSYRDVEEVSPQSTTETFFAGKFDSNSPLWSDTPIYVRTGKMMDRHVSHLTLVLDSESDLYQKGEKEAISVVLHPFKGVVCHFDIKSESALTSQPMRFTKHTEQGNTSEAYERIFESLFKHERRKFVSEDYLDVSWNLTQHIIDRKHEMGHDFPNYKPGSDGPDLGTVKPDSGWMDFSDV